MVDLQVIELDLEMHKNVANITPAIINLAIGYVITKTDDNNYTFDSGNSANKTVSGGGGSASAGPVTVVK